jgi:hypothetical protein
VAIDTFGEDGTLLAGKIFRSREQTRRGGGLLALWRQERGLFLRRSSAGGVYRCMKTRKEGIAVRRLDETRYAMSVDQVIRYVGSQEECERRAKILLAVTSREAQDRALMRVCGMR